MWRLLACASLALLAHPAFAQSWTIGPNRATAPPSISGTPTGGPNVGGFEIVCHQGAWSLYLFTGLSPKRDGDTQRATLTVDGERFETRYEMRPPSADDGLVITPEIIDALRAGTEVEIAFATGGTPYRATFTLRGSSRALSTVAERCAPPNPTTNPHRFRTAGPDSSSEAITLASTLFRPALEEAHDIDPAVGILSASFIDLDNGWRFLVSDIGPSTAIYGVVAYATMIAAQPPGGPWRTVTSQVGAAVYIDNERMTNGYPHLIYQSVRGVNQPFTVWTWTGEGYDFSGRLDD